MGLDIYKYRPIMEKTKDHYITLDKNLKASVRMFDKFKNFIQLEDEEFLDLDLYFEKRGLDFSNYKFEYSTGLTGAKEQVLAELNDSRADSINNVEFIDIMDRGNTEQKFIGYLVFSNIKTGAFVLFEEDVLPIKVIQEQVIYVEETGYQRKGMNRSFYTEFLSGCWYVDNDSKINEEDSLDVLSSKEEFDKMKEYVVIEDGYFLPIMEWDFKEGEDIVWLSY